MTGLLIKYGLVALLSTGVLWKAYSTYSDYKTDKANAVQTLANEVEMRRRAELERDSLIADNRIQEAIDEQVSIIREESQREMKRFTDEANQDKAVLEDRARLNKVSSGSQYLMVERRANAATEKVLNDLEEALE